MTTLFIFYFLLLLAEAFEAHTSAHHPNILLLIVDDLRPTLGCYGDTYALTPNIDALARRGTVFTKAYAQQALCGPSRTSFLTSRRPDTTKLYDVHSYWRTNAGNFTTLPQYFKDHGYHTVSFGKVFHPGIVSNYSDDQPYSWSEDPYHPPTQAFKDAPVCLGSDGSLQRNIYCPVEVEQQPGKNLPDIETTVAAVKWLENRSLGGDQPFFMAVGFHKPHIPLKFPVRFIDYYPIDTVPMPSNENYPKGLPSVAWNPWNDLRRRDDIRELNISFPYGPIPKFYARYIRQGYYAATTYVDSLIGYILAKVESHFPDTIVALLGDHGWSLGEHQEWSKYSNFEVATRVPFIISKLKSGIDVLSDKADSKNRVHEFRGKNFDISNGNESLNHIKILHSLFVWESDDSNFHAKYEERHYSKGENSHFSNYEGLVELVDLFPTLVDLVGLPAVPSCPEYSQNIEICSEGNSLAPLLSTKIHNTIENTIKPGVSGTGIKKVSFSQYPRPGLNPSVSPDSDQPRTSETKIIGYSMRTHRFRYTTWLKFNNVTYKPDWSEVLAEELYDHKFDDNEDHNVCHKKLYQMQRKHLLKLLIHWRKRTSWA